MVGFLWSWLKRTLNREVLWNDFYTKFKSENINKSILLNIGIKYSWFINQSFTGELSVLAFFLFFTTGHCANIKNQNYYTETDTTTRAPITISFDLIIFTLLIWHHEGLKWQGPTCSYEKKLEDAFTRRFYKYVAVAFRGRKRESICTETPSRRSLSQIRISRPLVESHKILKFALPYLYFIVGGEPAQEVQWPLHQIWGCTEKSNHHEILQRLCVCH